MKQRNRATGHGITARQAIQRRLRLLTATFALLSSSAALAKDLPNINTYFDAPDVSISRVSSLQALTRQAGGFATSFDEKLGVPTFIFAVGQHLVPTAITTTEDAARYHLGQFLSAYQVTRGALDAARVAYLHDLGHGPVIVTFQQQVDGIDVFRGKIKVMMRQNLELVAISGWPHPAAVPGAKFGKVVVSPQQALAKAIHDLVGVAVPPSTIVDSGRREGGYQAFDLAQTPLIQASKLHLIEPARIKRVLFPMPNSLVPGYFVEFLAGKIDETSSDAYQYVIAADDGRILFRQNLTDRDSFDYRVWASTSGDKRPFEGPQADWSPHPTGVADISQPAFVPPNLVSMEGFNTNPSGVADPWLLPGAVQTLGNNVDAYVDHNAPDGYSMGDFRATTTSQKVIDRVYDTSLGPADTQDQSMAALAQLFYTNNWLHDYYYDSGFDEASGNAQQDNFGRGGIGGDPIRAEGQDGFNTPEAPRNNANMQALSDGSPPRMQMYLWTDDDRSMLIQPGDLTPATGLAAFGPPNYSLTGDVVLAEDQAGIDPNDACEAITNNVAGQIALIHRGTCTFKQKALNAEAAGAIGVIVAAILPGQSAPNMSNGDPAEIPVNIGVQSVGTDDGIIIKNLLMNGPVTAYLFRQPNTERDGTIDNTIVAHEWGHYIHRRLTNCASRQCAAVSEGWGDWIALHLAIDEGDNLSGAFPLAVYSAKGYGPTSGFFGIRRRPYSTDFGINAFSFRHIQDNEPLPNLPLGSGGGNNAEVHNAGEIWAAMLFEGYAELLKQTTGPNPVYTFDQVRRLMADYIVAGMKMAPVDATYTEQRDGILAAALANNLSDAVALATGFAKRGAGSCARSPQRYSMEFLGVQESFEVKPYVQLTTTSLDDSLKSCDTDGTLDAEEIGRLTLKIANGGLFPLVNTTVEVSTSTSGVSFLTTPSFTIPTLDPFSSTSFAVKIAVDEAFMGVGNLDLQVNVTNSAACNPVETAVLLPRINYDNVSNASATDTVESDVVLWATKGTPAHLVWSRFQAAANNHVWQGIDFGGISDTQLESPAMLVGPTDPFIISFDHVHQFDSSSNPDIFLDGGVIEITSDGGANWVDINTLVASPYGGFITNTSNNPLADREAFVNTNPSFPSPDTVTLDLGNTLASKWIKIRFRIATDSANPSPTPAGWQIDNIAFQGIVNKPFPTIVEDQSPCDMIPIPDAGPDQTVYSGDQVTLDASNSADPNGDVLSFNWTQTTGPNIALSGVTSAKPFFTAPDVDADTTLSFEVAVSDGQGTVVDTVDVLVLPPLTTTSSSGTGGSGGGGGSGGSPSTVKPIPPSPAGGCRCEMTSQPRGLPTWPAALVALLAFRCRHRRNEKQQPSEKK